MRVCELEKELQSLRNEKEDLKVRVNEAEVEIDELHLKVENVSYFLPFGRKVIL